ncbi:antibiotic ABC transporter [Pararhodobacter sp.]|uniref:antibiotic ABC transporter n=1 Tax=Pararhodobacter sp. TaxID=2127056 RepID=UPI002FE35F10
MVFPFSADLFRLSLETSLMTLQAQQVVAMRMLGLMGAWRTRDGEAARMMTEKLDALGEATLGMGKALALAQSPLHVAEAALAPYARRTSANHRTLSRRGPGRPA